jgi:hypothetical protein
VTCKRSGYDVPKRPNGRPIWCKVVPFSNSEKYECKRCHYRRWYHSNPELVKKYYERYKIKHGILARGEKQKGSKRKYYAGKKVKG